MVARLDGNVYKQPVFPHGSRSAIAKPYPVVRARLLFVEKAVKLKFVMPFFLYALVNRRCPF